MKVKAVPSAHGPVYSLVRPNSAVVSRDVSPPGLYVFTKSPQSGVLVSVASSLLLSGLISTSKVKDTDPVAAVTPFDVAPSVTVKV